MCMHRVAWCLLFDSEKRRGKCRGFEMSPMTRDRLWDERAPLGPPKISWAHQERECLRRADILHKTSSLYKERGNYQTVCTSQGGQLPERKVRSSVLLQVLYRRIDCSPGLIAGADTLGLTQFCLLGLTESSWHSSRTVIFFHQLRSLNEGWSAEWIELCYVIIGILHFNLNKLIKYFSKIIQLKILKRIYIYIYIYIKKTRHIYIYIYIKNLNFMLFSCHFDPILLSNWAKTYWLCFKKKISSCYTLKNE